MNFHNKFENHQYNMRKYLSSQGVCFDFLIQKQENACKQPIEDPTFPWETKWIKVGTLYIEPQVRTERTEPN